MFECIVRNCITVRLVDVNAFFVPLSTNDGHIAKEISGWLIGRHWLYTITFILFIFEIFGGDVASFKLLFLAAGMIIKIQKQIVQRIRQRQHMKDVSIGECRVASRRTWGEQRAKVNQVTGFWACDTSTLSPRSYPFYMKMF